MTPVLNGWVLGAYTAMLGRLSAATAALEATEVLNIPSDSDSESEHSSYTEKYVEFIHFYLNYNICNTMIILRFFLKNYFPSEKLYSLENPLLWREL